MNERIRELAEQAGFLNKDEESIEYFAELIVRECEKVVACEIEQNNKPNVDWGWDDHEQGYVSGMWAATRFMKEHFGVEE